MKRWTSTRVGVAIFAVVATIGLAYGGTASAQTSTTSASGKLSGTPVKVVAFLEQTGALASIGKNQLAGVQLWVDTIGKTQGILGRPVQLIVKDDGGTAATAGPVAREIVDLKPDLIVGPLPSAVGGAVLPLFNDAKILNINTGSLNTSSDPTTYPFTFNANAMKTTEAQAQYDYLCKLGLTKVGILSPTGPVGDAQVAAAQGRAASAPCSKKLDVLDTQRYDLGAADVSTQVQKLQQQGVEAVMLGSFTATDIASVFRSMKDLGWKPWVFANGSANDKIALATADPALLEKVLPFGGYPNIALPMTKEAKQYKAAMEKANLSTTVMTQSFGGYAAMQIAAAAANGAGSLDPTQMVGWLETHPVQTINYAFKYSPTLHNGITPEEYLPTSVGTADDQGFVKLAPPAAVLKKKVGKG
jgi:branched-chain amino acid transport system substrate-binding protein